MNRTLLIAMAMVSTLVVAVPRSGQAENRFLTKARTAYEALQYGRVLPLLKRAKKIAKTPEERVAIHELEAIMHVTFDRPKQARAAFDAVLDITPAYRPPDDWSPKILAVYEEAKAARPAGEPAADPQSPGDTDPNATADPDADPDPDTPPDAGGDPLAATDPTSQPAATGGPTDPPPPGLAVTPAASSPIYAQWWFWTAVGVVVVGGAVATTWALYDPLPERDLGPYKLP